MLMKSMVKRIRNCLSGCYDAGLYGIPVVIWNQVAADKFNVCAGWAAVQGLLPYEP